MSDHTDVSSWYILRVLYKEQTFDVALEQLGQDAIRGQLVKHAAEELLGYTCYIPWDQHTAKHHRENGSAGQAVTLHINYYTRL